MISIDKTKKRVIVNLNKEFYNVDSVKKAAEDFKDTSDISVSDKEAIIIIMKLKDSSYLNNIGYEFCNYVLALMKNEALV